MDNVWLGLADFDGVGVYDLDYQTDSVVNRVERVPAQGSLCRFLATSGTAEVTAYDGRTVEGTFAFEADAGTLPDGTPLLCDGEREADIVQGRFRAVREDVPPL